MVALPPIAVPGEIRIPTEPAKVALPLATPLLLNRILGALVAEKEKFPEIILENVEV
jgi:hypothetical protein